MRGWRDKDAWLDGLRIAFWGFAYFVFYFVQQVTELVAPLVLVLGLGWWALPRLVEAITTHEAAADQQVRDILDSIAVTIPTGLQMAGHWVTPGGLIASGLGLMAIAAIAATMSALAAREM
ncbi:hypothetical protein [Lichenicoccus sp.]|uniref:hypothetical protein n=1 Tax=Lichenicoccus sp. TaxID=2781899 RepID=UPI003D11CC80